MRHPDAFAHLLRALDFHLSPTSEVALVGEELAPLAAVVRAGLRPHWCWPGARRAATRRSCSRDRPTIDGRPAAYVCERFTCRAPATDPRRSLAARR